jgi:MoaA/NifB/PqqE/SkfB family radical SAM enzyme
MRLYCPTGLLRRLLWKGLLADRLNWLGILSDPLVRWLKELDRSDGQEPCKETSRDDLELLENWGLVSDIPLSPGRSSTIPLAFVKAVNLELTYDCRLECSHCLQSGIRKRLAGTWLSAVDAERIVTEAWFAGFLETGVNITGGETVAVKSTLIDLVENLRLLGLPYRLNTSGWWGGNKDIRIGSRVFPTDRSLITWLKECGLEILALSLDSRYEMYPDLYKNVLALIHLCENLGIRCQIVSTGVKPEEITRFHEKLSADLGYEPEQLSVAPMDEIDIGGAAAQSPASFQPERLAELPDISDCHGRGFYRPAILHIAPDGGVRGCMYSPGTSELGNAVSESPLALVNHFHLNPVAELFEKSDFESFIHKNLMPFAEIYRGLEHPCAVSALLARIASEVSDADDNADLLLIHKKIAGDLNIDRKLN